MGKQAKVKNKFSILLQSLMTEAELKNSVLAESLQYDVSYISKWSGGSFLPSEKNISRVSDAIASCVVDFLPEEKRDVMFERYRSSDLAELRNSICRALLDAYYESKNRSYEEKQESAEVYVLGVPVRSLIEEIKISDMCGKKAEIAAVVDVFSLDHESRLLLAGIEKGGFAIQDNFPEIHFSVILNTYPTPVHEDKDYVYDSIFLIHMLTSFSKIDFQLYNQFFAYGKYIYAEKDNYSVTGMLHEKENQCFAAVKSTDAAAVNGLYQKIKLMCSQETLIFRKSTVHAMIKNHEYIQSILAPEVCLLLGHMTELMVPPSLFDELAAGLPEAWNSDRDELKRTHDVSSNILEKSNISVMVYESALTNFVVSGELDFYNCRLYLPPGQRLACLEFISDILHRKGFEGVKLIDGGFSTDFQYITNPCLFMSSSICYLRLENGCYENNILILNDKSVRNMFLRFWQEIWNKRTDVVVEGEDALSGKMEHYMQSVMLLEYMK